MAIYPFGLSLNTLVKSDVKDEMVRLRNGCDFALENTPSNQTEAWGAICGYLSGTADYEKWKVEEKLKTSKEFIELNVSNFRSKAARELRDSKLEKGVVNFLIQSFRYRGKANYRDSIYLSYGSSKAETIGTFINDLNLVAETYLRMACNYSCKRVEKGTRGKFSEDLHGHLNIEVSPRIYDIK